MKLISVSFLTLRYLREITLPILGLWTVGASQLPYAGCLNLLTKCLELNEISKGEKVLEGRE